MTDTRIMLASGALFDFLEPEGSDFTLQDIAHGLGQVCRFAGHTNRFYSVAEHCVFVARLVPVEHARAALLHDASVAFIGDVTRPLKALLPDYRAIEARIDAAIAARFLSPAEHARGGVAAPEIKRADAAMCQAEAYHLMPDTDRFWANQRAEIDPEIWAKAKATRLSYDRPEYATQSWLRAWNRYGHWLDDLARNEHERAATE